MSLEFKYDGIGISSKINQIYNHEDNWKAVYSIRKADSDLYEQRCGDKSDSLCNYKNHEKNRNDSSFNAYKLPLYKNGVLITDLVHTKNCSFQSLKIISEHSLQWRI